MKKRLFNIVVSLLLVSIYIVGFTENIQVYASDGNVKLSVKKLYTLSEHITTYPYITIENYNDIKVGDIIEAYEMVEVKR